MFNPALRLTRFARGDGCGGKIPPAVLHDILSRLPPGIAPRQLLVGTETGDDAAVYQLNGQQAIVATSDFFQPMVDDPFDFGRIAATGAISNIYAMGGTPLFALALAGMPTGILAPEAVARILEGGQSVCGAAGIPVAGGHSIESSEPVYGLAVVGLVNPAHLRRNSTARPGDRLILGKPLGGGVYATALRQGRLHASDYDAFLATALLLNTPGPLLACLDGVHAVTDVAGCGLVGHLLEVCKGSGVRATVRVDDLPLLPRAGELIREGCQPDAAAANWARYRPDVAIARELDGATETLLADPQISGGLLVSCAPASVTEVLSLFLQQGFPHVSVIGETLAPGEHGPGIEFA